MKTAVKNRKSKIHELKSFIEKTLSDFNIIGKANIPSEPDNEGDYYIIVYADNIKSFPKAFDMEKKIQKIIREKFGDNFLISIIPK
ncbi:hypothetical protein [Persephonella sp.]